MGSTQSGQQQQVCHATVGSVSLQQVANNPRKSNREDLVRSGHEVGLDVRVEYSDGRN